MSTDENTEPRRQTNAGVGMRGGVVAQLEERRFRAQTKRGDLRLSAIGLSAIDYRLSAIGYRLIGNRQSAIGLSAIDNRLSAYRQSTIGNRQSAIGLSAYRPSAIG